MSIKTHTGSYPVIGEVTYNRNSRAKRLSIRINRTGEVRITIPGTLPFKVAESFVLSKTDWIAKKVQEIENSRKLAITPNYKTRNHTIRFIASSVQKISIRYQYPYVDVVYPPVLNTNTDSIQTAAKKAIELAYRYEATHYLPDRLIFLAKEHGFNCSRLTIRNSTTRWGSCSVKNSINLSLYLMKLPDELIDYVILHELCHTVHKNHGAEFWKLLNHHCLGNAKRLAREVKRYSTTI
ncbi:MAG: M48 family metallopeptidase [Bacteroidales bacterium]